ncbi:hypothetical protein RY27_17775 [Litorilinea aerophila]|nr:hypothetical protein RY27_17775 [Litorilinea aerophila]
MTPSTFVVHGSQSGLIAGTYAVSGDGQTVSLTPAASLFPGERVDAILTTGLANTSGEPLDAPHVWQFWAQAGIATGIYGFSGQPLGAANQQSYAVAAGDLNQDGFPDLVVGNAKAGGHNTIYLNDGTGSFGTISQTLPTLDSTRSVLLVDMDMDGDLDLVVGNHGKQNYIYLNNGNGTFATPGLPFGPDNDTTYSLAAGDLDGNGTIDLVVGNVITSPMGIYFNNGNATFSSQSYTLPVEGQVWSVALGDVDGDGDLDLAVGNYSNPNQIFLNDGHGNFIQPGINLRDATDLTHRLVLGDVDGDGDLDAVTANAGLNYVYYNNGDGTFSANRHPFGVSYDNSMGLALGDVDGDGDLDVVVANDVGAAKNPGESGNVVYLNDGDGTFDTTAYLFGGVSDRSQAVALADFDGDGDLDLAAVNAAMAGENPVPQQSAVYFNANASDPAITFSMQPTSTVPGGTVRYFLRFQNQGQAASHQVIITITLPAQVTITNIETSGAPVTMSGSGQIRVFQAGSLAAQASGQITVTGTLVTGLAPNTQFSATASITGSGDGYLLNNNASAVGQVLNGPPNAVDDSFTIPEDSPNTALSVLANDSDPNGDPLSIYAVGIPDHGGVVNFNASTITYRPAANFAGTEVFTYTARDGRGGYGTANVIVTVTPVNDPPDARNDSATVDEDSGDTFIDVLANDTSAPDTGETLTVIAVGTPSRGGTVSFTPGGVT